MRPLIALALLAACGGSSHPAPAAAAPSCAEVGAHLVVLAEHDNGAPASDDVAAGIRGETERRCTDEAWSAERRACLAGAATQDETLGCPAR